MEETCFFLVDDWGECGITNDHRVSFVFRNQKQDRKKIGDFLSNAILYSLLYWRIHALRLCRYIGITFWVIAIVLFGLCSEVHRHGWLKIVSSLMVLSSLVFGSPQTRLIEI